MATLSLYHSRHRGSELKNHVPEKIVGIHDMQILLLRRIEIGTMTSNHFISNMQGFQGGMGQKD
jgi:hypothetical protein